LDAFCHWAEASKGEETEFAAAVALRIVADVTERLDRELAGFGIGHLHLGVRRGGQWDCHNQRRARKEGSYANRAHSHLGHEAYGREQIAVFDKAVQQQVRTDPICRLLMTVPGIARCPR
jgi:hypothetical protein